MTDRAASRILVTGLSVAATLSLATAMASSQENESQPAAAPASVEVFALPGSVAVSATTQPALTTSHAS